MKAKSYTVVGLYPDNDESYVEWVEAAGVDEAMKKAIEIDEARGSPGGLIIAVFAGEQEDLWGRYFDS